MFIDSHAHLEGNRYDNDREEVLARAKQNGIQARHYAIDREQHTLYSNAAMAAHAVRNALERAGLDEPARSADVVVGGHAELSLLRMKSRACDQTNCCPPSMS